MTAHADICRPCAEAELGRLTAERAAALAARDLDGADVREREIAQLLRLTWPCGEPDCDEPVTLGRILSRRETAR